MKITGLIEKKQTLSFEVYPPKDTIPLDAVAETLSRLYRFHPDFISCTYGAGGALKRKNMELCKLVKNGGQELISHYTCIGSSRESVRETVREYIDLGVENLLALRGDFPEGWEGTQGDFAHADELLAFIGAEFPGLCLGAAAYPEKHLTAASPEEDIRHLLSKQDSGAHFIMTQLCYDTNAFEKFLEKIRNAGIRIPVIAGVMPVLSREPTIRMTLSNGCSIPADLAGLMGLYSKNPSDFTKAGINYTAELIARFRKLDIAGIHLYTMNKWEALSGILTVAGYSE